MAIKQEVYFADDGASGGWTGLGTPDQPFRGGPGYVWIDSILTLPPTDPVAIPPYTTLRFGPGTFLTNGSNHSTSGWAVRSWVMRSMQLFSGQTTVALFVITSIFLILLAVGLHPVLALGVGVIAGWLLAYTLLSTVGDRLEHWLRTYK